VVLTGSNNDGAAGARYVKEHGGRVFVEDPATAHSSVMPASAIAAAAPVDLVLPLPLLCERLVEACK
jgi:two-component system CheB/CheR fusion protein